MKRILKYIIFITIIALVFYCLYLYPGKVIIFSFSGYKIYSSIFSLAVLITAIIIIFYLVKLLKNILYVLFDKISLSYTLKQYIKQIELSNSIDKAIHLNLINEIKDLKTLNFVVYLNTLISKNQNKKALKIIKRYEKKYKLKNILNYYKVEALLGEGNKKEAVELCKVYLNNNKSSKWAFLRLFDISIKENNSDLQFLNNFLVYKYVSLDPKIIEKIYCIINYKLALQEYEVDNNAMYKRLTTLIKKYPDFTPSYALAVKYLLSIGEVDKAINLITNSWQYNITYENTILVDYLFVQEKKDFIIKEANKAIKNKRYDNKDQKWILLIIIHAAYNDLLNVNEYMIRIHNKNGALYQIANLYLLLKENNIKESKNLVSNFANDLPLSWWNEYLKIEAKPQ